MKKRAFTGLLAFIIILSLLLSSVVMTGATTAEDVRRDGEVFVVTHYNPKYPTTGVSEEERNRNHVMATGELCQAIEDITYAEVNIFEIDTLYVGLPYDAVEKVKALDTVISVEPYSQSIGSSKAPEEKIDTKLSELIDKSSPDDVIKGVMITLSYEKMVYYGFNEMDFSDPQDYIVAKRAVDKEYHTKINTQLFEEIDKEVDMELLSKSLFAGWIIVEIKASEIEKLSQMPQVSGIYPPEPEAPDDAPDATPTENPTESPEQKFKYEEKLQDYIGLPKYDPNKHEGTFGTYSDYDELYEYSDEATGEVDWVLITAKCDMTNPWSVLKTKRMGDRVLSWWTYGAAFLPYSLGLYDAKEDKFKDIGVVKADDYEGLVEAIEELKLGYELGDTDLDSQVTVLDATRIQMYVADILKSNNPQFQLVSGVSDMDDDGEVTVLDATAVQLKIAKIEK